MTSSRYIDAVIGGLGTATPLGKTAWASAAAVRAGLSAFAEHPFMVDSEGVPMRVAQCPWLIVEPRVDVRIADCLVIAIRSALQALLTTADVAHGIAPALFVNLPALRPGMPPSLIATVHASLQRAFSGVFARVELMQLGHAGGFVALQSAAQSLGVPHDACIVAGGDSYLDPDTLEWLEDTDQLHGAGPRNNAWGFVPGEGAGALLLVTRKLSARARMVTLGRLETIGIGREPSLIRTDAVCVGRGLTEAFRAVFDPLPSDLRATDVYCDMNGEPYRADEFGFTVTRIRERFVNPSDFFAPADCWGDVGAASAPLAIALACIASSKNYAKGPRALVWASSESGERGAALIQSTAGATW